MHILPFENICFFLSGWLSYDFTFTKNIFRNDIVGKDFMDKLKFPKDLDRSCSQKLENHIGYLSIHVPEELIIAAGKIPYRILGSEKPAKKATVHLPKTFDPYVLACLEGALEGNYRSLDGVIISNISDAHRRLYDVWQSAVNSQPVFMLDVPKGSDSLRKKCFRSGISYLKHGMEKAFDVEITDERLNLAIELCNETRQLLKKLGEQRNLNSCPFSASDFFKIIRWSQTEEKKIVNDTVTEYLEAIEKRQACHKNETGHEKPRIMIVGSAMVSPDIISAIEEKNARVVCEDLCIGMPYFKSLVDHTDDNPLESLANRYLTIPTSRMVDTESRWKSIMESVKDSRTDGIIYFALKFDDIHLFEYPYIRDKLQKEGYPVLFIEAENFLTTMGQMETRIEAFIEMLEG